MAENIGFDDIRTPARFEQEHPELFDGKGSASLEYIMRTRKINGLLDSGAVVEPVERRPLIVVPKFLAWLLARHQAA